MLIEIKNRFDNSVLFAHDAEPNSMRITVEQAIKVRANLSYANLRDANLSGANLFGANLRGANLRDADLRDANLSYANLRGADLSYANLSGANLIGADLRGANLSYANLSGANLSDANLSGADLSGANLSGANLSGANLSGADLRDADLRDADLRDADLCGANLNGADLSGANLPAFQLIPEIDSFIGWKKLKGGIVAKVQIPAKAKRTSSLIGRKNRAEFVKVLWLSNAAKVGVSIHDNKTKYVVGETVYPDSYNDTIQEECVNGIHFFITRKEAEEY